MDDEPKKRNSIKDRVVDILIEFLIGLFFFILSQLLD